MGKFSRIKKHRKLSSTLSIDEKIEFLNKEMKKTGVLSEKMTTSDMYTKTSFTPYIPATWDEVPDSSGITGDGWTQPGDPTDSSTYDVNNFENTTLYTDMSYLKNPNNLNGETDRAILDGVGSDLLSAAGMDAGFGIALNGNYYGLAIGYVGGGRYHGVLSGGLTGGTESPTESSRGYGGIYRGVSDENFAVKTALWNLWYSKYYNDYYASPSKLVTKNITVWVPYNRHHHYQRGGEYADWPYPKSGGYILENVAIVMGRNTYQNQNTEHAKTTVLQRIGIGDPTYYPGDVGNFLMKLLNLGKEGWQYLSDKAGKLNDDTLDDLDKRWNRLNNQIDKFVDDVGEIAGEVRDLWNGVQDGRHLLSNVMATIQAAELSNSIDENGNIKPEAQGSPQNPLKNEVRDSTAKDIIQGIDWSQNPPVAYDQFGKAIPIGQQIQDNVSAAPWEDGGNIGAKGTHNNLPNYGKGTSNTPAPYINENGDLIIPDTFYFGPGGHETKWLPRATRATIDGINKFAAGRDGTNRYKGGNLISDEQRRELDLDAATIMDQSLGILIPNIPGRKDPVVHFQTVIPAEQLNRIKGKQKTNDNTSSWQPEKDVKTAYDPNQGTTINFKKQSGAGGDDGAIEVDVRHQGGEIWKGKKGEFQDPYNKDNAGKDSKSAVQKGLDDFDVDKGKVPIEFPNQVLPGLGVKDGDKISSKWMPKNLKDKKIADASSTQLSNTMGRGLSVGGEIGIGGNEHKRFGVNWGQGNWGNGNIINWDNNKKPGEIPSETERDAKTNKELDQQLKKLGIDVSKIRNGTQVASVNYDLDNWINKTYGSGASNWYRQSGGKIDGNPFIPAGSYIPRAKKKVNSNIQVTHYEPQGELIKEDISDVSLAWASPKHTNIERNERERWFNTKDIQPLVPKKPTPKMVDGYHADSKLAPQKVNKDPFIKITEKDILRNHKLSDYEKKEWTDTINAINEFLTAHPEELIHARQRYPKNDPKLAELNWKLDQMLGASEEYIDSHFPENTRLFNTLQKATKKTIQLTDPEYIGKHYDEVRGTLRTVNDFNQFGSDTKKKQNAKLRKKNPARFFKKPKGKSKSSFLKHLDPSDIMKKNLKVEEQLRIEQEIKEENERRLNEYVDSVMENESVDWRNEIVIPEKEEEIVEEKETLFSKVLQEKIANSTSGVLSGGQSLASAGDTDLQVIQTGLTGDGGIDFGEPGAYDSTHTGEGEFTAYTNMGDMRTVEDPTGVGPYFRALDYDYGSTGSNQSFNTGSTGWAPGIPGFKSHSHRNVRPSGVWDSHNNDDYSARYGSTNDVLGLTWGQWNNIDGVTDYGLGTILQTVPQGSGWWSTDDIDASEVDTIKLHAIVHSSKITSAGSQIQVYYWAGNKPGFQSFAGNIYAGGEPLATGKPNDGWRPLYQKPDGTIDNTVSHIIIGTNRPAANASKLAAYSLSLPEWCRGKNSRFIFFGAGSNANYSMTSLRFQRKNPIIIGTTLDSPEASSFMRVGQGNESTSPEKRKKKIEDMLKASRAYLLQILGYADFPGMGASLDSIAASPTSFDEVGRAYADTLSQEERRDYYKFMADKQRSAARGNKGERIKSNKYTYWDSPIGDPYKNAPSRFGGSMKKMHRSPFK